MAKTKRSAAKDTEQTYDLLHGAFVAATSSLDEAPSLRELARTFGIPFREVDRRATIGHWQEERDATEVRCWMANHGGGATTEEEFRERHTARMYAHVAGTPEGDRWIRALARRSWAWHAGRIEIWESIKEEEAAHEALNAREERDRGCATCPRRAAA